MTEQLVLNSFIAKAEDYLDRVVDTGSDQELFISSYLQGHFAVEAAQQQLADTSSISQLDAAMQQSLQCAFDAGELEERDQQQVWALWQRLLNMP